MKSNRTGEAGTADRQNKKLLNGMRGVHLVAAELARQGFAPVVTSRNTAFADILAQPMTFEGSPLSISVKFNQGRNNGSFFLLGRKPLPKNRRAFFALVLESKDQPRFWIVPSRALADSPATAVRPGVRRLDSVPRGYMGLHNGIWGFEVYFNQLPGRYENGWDLLVRASRDRK